MVYLPTPTFKFKKQNNNKTLLIISNTNLFLLFFSFWIFFWIFFLKFFSLVFFGGIHLRYVLNVILNLKIWNNRELRSPTLPTLNTYEVVIMVNSLTGTKCRSWLQSFEHHCCVVYQAKLWRSTNANILNWRKTKFKLGFCLDWRWKAVCVR